MNGISTATPHFLRNEIENILPFHTNNFALSLIRRILNSGINPQNIFTFKFIYFKYFRNQIFIKCNDFFNSSKLQKKSYL